MTLKTPPRPARSVVAFTFAAVLVAGVLPACGQESRDAGRLIEALGLAPGRVVAEIGAGDGDLSVAVAEAVGPGGRVYTNELSSRQLEAAKRKVEQAGLANVTFVEGHVDRTNLPDGCCDAIFMRNVYHHFDDKSKMNQSLLTSLRPGGRLAIIDFVPGTTGGQHGVEPDEVTRDLEAAGFTIVALDTANRRSFLVVAAKPQ